MSSHSRLSKKRAEAGGPVLNFESRTKKRFRATQSKGDNLPRPCSVCSHPELAAIDQALASGEAVRAVAKRFELGKDAVSRHQSGHGATAIPNETAAPGDLVIALPGPSLWLVTSVNEGAETQFEVALIGPPHPNSYLGRVVQSITEADILAVFRAERVAAPLSR